MPGHFMLQREGACWGQFWGKSFAVKNLKQHSFKLALIWLSKKKLTCNQLHKIYGLLFTTDNLTNLLIIKIENKTLFLKNLFCPNENH